MTYRPPHVRADDRAPLLDLIAAHPLATFITVADGAPVVTYLPMLAREENGAVILEGHLARANNQWRGGDGTAAALFRVAEHYVSPTWYATKHINGRVVPTFDYIAVEARGAVHFIDDAVWLREFVARLTHAEETKVGANWTTRGRAGRLYGVAAQGDCRRANACRCLDRPPQSESSSPGRERCGRDRRISKNSAPPMQRPSPRSCAAISEVRS